jgi:branched-subunit amino acid ABC-type transport system permease component
MVKECYVGHHITWVLKNHPNGLTIYHKIQVAYPMIYALMCTFPKLAILGLYLRIFVEKRDRVASYVLMAVLSSWCVSIIIANGLQCIPIACLWNPAGHPNGHCFNINQFWKWFSFGNILTDFVMLLLPFPCIWKLRISRRDKIGLVITFCTGSV